MSRSLAIGAGNESHAGSLLANLLTAKTVAVVGASPRNLVAQLTISNLRRFGADTRIYAVHPAADPGDAATPARSLGDVSESIDLCVALIGTSNLLGVVEEAAAIGVRQLVIPGAGANEAGLHVADDLRKLIVTHGLEVVGPNCMGFVSLHGGPAPYIGQIDQAVQPGHVGVISHSGSVCEVCTAMPWRIGFSHVVSVGNEFGLDITGALEFLVADPATEVIGLFVEGIRRPAEFRKNLEAAAHIGKPVVVLKVGRSAIGRAGAASHTGSMIGDSDVFSAVLRAANAIEARDLDQMLTLLEILGKRLTRPASKVVLIGDSGGEANLFADLAADQEVSLPALDERTASQLKRLFPALQAADNPLDLWALGPPQTVYEAGASTMLAHEPHLCVIGLDKFLANGQAARELVRAAVDGVELPGSALLMAYGGGDSVDPGLLEICWRKRIPVTRGANLTLSSLSALDGWHARQSQINAMESAGLLLEMADLLPAEPFGDGELAWHESRSKQFLSRLGVPVPIETEVRTADAAVAAARGLGFPVAIKASAPGLLHKSEVDGVRLNVSSDAAVAAVTTELLGRFPAVLVSEQIAADLELIVSAFIDRDFGACCLVGMGGLWVEELGDQLVVAGPGSYDDFRRALATRRWGRLVLNGARGRQFPVNSIAATVFRLIAAIDTARNRIEVIEINPLLVRPSGVVAVDALVIPAKRR